MIFVEVRRVFRVLFLSAAFLVAGDVFGQPNTRREPPGFSVITSDATAFKSAPLFFLNGKQSVEIALNPQSRSQTYPTPVGRRTILLARRSSDGSTMQTVAEVVSPTESTDQFLIFVMPGADGVSVKALAIDDSPKTNPAHTVRVLNACGVSLITRVNAYSGELTSGKITSPIEYPDMSQLPPNAFARYPFGLAVRSANGENIVLNSGFQEALPGTRTLLVVLAPDRPSSTKVRVRTFVDRPSPQILVAK
jgi:hypothetical protein